MAAPVGGYGRAVMARPEICQLAWTRHTTAAHSRDHQRALGQRGHPGLGADGDVQATVDDVPEQ